jgi:hypothetical protein
MTASTRGKLGRADRCPVLRSLLLLLPLFLMVLDP